MSNAAAAWIGIMENLNGRADAPQFVNADLAFHAAQMATLPGPGLWSRLAAVVSRVLAPRDLVMGTQGMSGHMMRDMGLETMPVAPGRLAPRGETQQRPVALGGRLAVSF